MFARPGLLLMYLGALTLMFTASGVAIAQRDRDGDEPPARRRDRNADQDQPREFREERRQRSEEPEEGYAEGMPGGSSEARSEDGAGRFRVRVRGWKLGVYARNTDTGVEITRVERGMPASRAGLERGDKIVTVGGYQVGYVDDYLYTLGEELQMNADGSGRVYLLVQNVRNRRLLPMHVRLTRDDEEFGRARE